MRLAHAVALLVPPVLAGGCPRWNPPPGGPDGGARPQVCGDGLLDSPELCDDGNVGDGDTCSAACDQGYAIDRWGPPTGAVDILFVVDNSGSMCEEQIALRDGFQSFLDGLTARGDVDFHIGVITTDTMDPAQLGRLQNIPNPIVNDMDCTVPLPPPQDCTTGLPDPLPKILTPDTPELARTFGCIAQVGIDGFGAEAPLAAVHLALLGPLADDPGGNAGFRRPDALLAIIFVGDEDDCSVCNDPNWPGECQFMPSITMNLDCAIFQNAYLTPVETFVQDLRAAGNGRGVFVGAIIGLDAAGNSQGPIYPDPDTIAFPDQLAPICTSDAGRAAPAPRLEDFARAFAPLADEESICQADFNASLLDAGDNLGGAMVGAGCLWRTPCPGLTPDSVSVSVELNGVVTTLSADELSLMPDSTCGGGMRLSFRSPPPPRAIVTVTYPIVTIAGEGCDAS